ncbi:fimbria/pilus outer membrane usher protein [Escherichia marmotae]|uniref:fimbria/pilus outer membrane usher protein n=1 Tax=Escherichia marmotae TaxID=1499973 RepID=UPI0028130092|nr:fimbria/pilus outer membrane usher protein [Escherichia marmotae]MDQ9267732.1 fimbrial biogenesis outer membrane usher protein [Escherichia marmotae]
MQLRKNLLLPSLLVFISNRAVGGDYFDPSLLAAGIDGENIDLSVFSHPGGGIEGEQDVSIWVNDNFYTRKKLNFRNTGDKGLLPDFPPDFFNNLLDAGHRPELKDGVISSADFMSQTPYSSVTFDQGEGRVDIRVPQAFLGRAAQLRSAPDTWDNGVPALLMDYSLTGNRNNSDDYSSRSLYASARFGLNLGPWHLRTSGNYSQYLTDSRWAHSRSESTSFYNTYLERDISALRASLRIGDVSTGGMILDSVSFRGVRLYSNDDMLNSRLRNYAPSIRGFARTQAVVVVTQNGRQVYQTNVPAGPFELNDFSISGYSGDLVVTVRESDGSEHSFIQPFSTLPEMKREGVSGFELSAGRYDNSGSEDYYDDPLFVYGAWSRGFSHGITVFGETLQAGKYQSAGIGSTLSLGRVGAVSADVSVSRAEKYDDLHTGQSYGLKYSKSQVDTGTTVTLATYRYSTKDFYSFGDFVSRTEQARYVWENRLKNRMSLSLNQSLGTLGSVSLSASQQDYWTSGEVNRSFSLSHSFSWKDIYFSTTFSMDQMRGNSYGYDNNRQIDFYMSVPLSRLLGREESTSSSVSWSATRTDRKLRQTATLSGSVPETQMRYRVGGNWGNGGADEGQSASLTWNGDFSTASLGYTHNGGYRTTDFSLSGSAVAWGGGVAFGSNSVTDNGAIVVNTSGVSGIGTSAGGRTTWPGTALISSPQLYTENRIDLRTDGLPDDIVLAETSAHTVPSRGAVVVLDYTVYRGGQVVFTLKRPDGSVLPFGTVVSLDGMPSGKENTGIVGDEGRVYLAGVPENGRLTVSSGGKQCHADFILPQDKKRTGPVTEIALVCR